MRILLIATILMFSGYANAERWAEQSTFNDSHFPNIITNEIDLDSFRSYGSTWFYNTRTIITVRATNESIIKYKLMEIDCKTNAYHEVGDTKWYLGINTSSFVYRMTCKKS